MKITLKSSGEVYHADHWETRIVSIDEEEIKGTTDWNAFRREAAKDILPSIITAASKVYEFESLDKDIWCAQAVAWADSLIKQLKEGQK